MYIPLEAVSLKSGEKVEAGIVVGPDAQWAERVQQLLGHKSADWYWQNGEFLSKDVGVEARFHILHRNGKPFSQILTTENQGVGLLGHVYTEPAERGQGAASLLMKRVLEQFRERNGKALFLGTAFDSSAYSIYQKLGFKSIEQASGTMAYYTGSREEFETEYFAAGATQLQPLDWPHWPVASALFAADVPGVVRCAPFRMMRRSLTEGPLLAPIREQREGEATRGVVLQKSCNAAVVGLAAWNYDPLWPDTILVDVFCHPNFWSKAPALLAEPQYPEAGRVIAYADTSCAEKRQVLQDAGFETVVDLPQWITRDTAHSSFVDVTLLEKKSSARSL